MGEAQPCEARLLPPRSGGSRSLRLQGLRPVLPPVAQSTEIRRQKSEFNLLPFCSYQGLVEAPHLALRLGYNA